MNDGGPAFPILIDDFRDAGEHPHKGMSLRAYFAGQALAGIYASPSSIDGTPAVIALVVTSAADALIEQLNK